jgi:hypothetical protein
MSWSRPTVHVARPARSILLPTSFVLVDLSASPGSGAAGERDLEQLQGAWGRAWSDFVDELFADKVRK